MLLTICQLRNLKNCLIATGPRWNIELFPATESKKKKKSLPLQVSNVNNIYRVCLLLELNYSWVILFYTCITPAGNFYLRHFILFMVLSCLENFGGTQTKNVFVSIFIWLIKLNLLLKNLQCAYEKKTAIPSCVVCYATALSAGHQQTLDLFVVYTPVSLYMHICVPTVIFIYICADCY